MSSPLLLWVVAVVGHIEIAEEVVVLCGDVGGHRTIVGGGGDIAT